MPEDKPTDVKTLEEEKKEDAVETAAEPIKEAPEGQADSGDKDAKTDEDIRQDLDARRTNEKREKRSGEIAAAFAARHG